MKSIDHRHSHTTPVGLLILKVGIAVAGAVVNKMIIDKVSKPPATTLPPLKKK